MSLRHVISGLVVLFCRKPVYVKTMNNKIINEKGFKVIIIYDWVILLK